MCAQVLLHAACNPLPYDMAGGMALNRAMPGVVSECTGACTYLLGEQQFVVPCCRLPARYSVAGGAAPRKRDSVLSRGSLPTIMDDEDNGGGGGGITRASFGALPPAVGNGNLARPRARFRESMMALILPARRRTSVRMSGAGGDVPIPEGMPAGVNCHQHVHQQPRDTR